MPVTVYKSIVKRIRGSGRGFVFSPRNFLDLGSRAAVDQTLSRLVKAGVVRRVGRGVYDYPIVSPRLGPLSPSPTRLSAVLARDGRERVTPSGAVAANALGLTTQVPARIVYLTDGPTRCREIDGRAIELRHTAPRWLDGVGTAWGAAVRAIRYLGRGAASDAMYARLRATLTAKDRRALAQKARFFPQWMYPILIALADDQPVPRPASG